MSRFHSYIISAKQILTAYNGGEPLASFLKKYFATNKKFGSKDRREVSSLCFSFFRMGKTAAALPLEERILAGRFLSTTEPDKLLEALKPEWNDKVQLPAAEKLQLFAAELKNIFPFEDEISNGIEFEKFAVSFLVQPDLFIRIRPGYEKTVVNKLIQAGITFNQVSRVCIRLPNASKLEAILELNKEAVIQDYSSQRVGEFLSMIVPEPSGQRLKVWDCCAASGGKSILASDTLGNIDLMVSDVRESILINLKKRFREARIKNYQSLVADLTNNYLPAEGKYDMIIADAPCSGSGTWARTPEQNVFFEVKKIAEYAVLQKKIVSTVIPCLQPGGYLLYITCSVFKKENEEIADFIKEQFHLQVLKMELRKGYDVKADTMFAVLFQKIL